jgi:DNA-binding response OmpR family regulator
MSIPAAPTDGKFRILIVEDDHNIARLVMVNLTRAGLECRYAADGIAGYAAFEETNPHLVLTDIMMPGMNGRELCAKIRETSNVPIIMMTAADSDSNQVNSFKAGADDYIAKPFNPQLLAARVVATLRRVYRYDVTTVKGAGNAIPTQSDPVDDKPVPPGWSSCDSCGYMGPRVRFEGTDATGRPTMICPNCRESTVTFSIG